MSIFGIDYTYASEIRVAYRMTENDVMSDNYYSYRASGAIDVPKESVSYVNWEDQEEVEENFQAHVIAYTYIAQAFGQEVPFHEGIEEENYSPVISNNFYFSAMFVNEKSEMVTSRRCEKNIVLNVENWPEPIDGVYPEITNNVSLTIAFTNTIPLVGDFNSVGRIEMYQPSFMTTVFMPSNVVVRLSADIRIFNHFKYYPFLPPNTNDYRILRVEDIAFVNEAIQDRLDGFSEFSVSNVVVNGEIAGRVQVPFRYEPGIDYKQPSFNRHEMTNRFAKIDALCKPNLFANGVPYLVQFIRPDMVEYWSEDARHVVYPSVWKESREYGSIDSERDVFDWICSATSLNKTNRLFNASPSLSDILWSYERLSDAAYIGSLSGLAVATTNSAITCDRINSFEEHGDFYKTYDYEGAVYGTNVVPRSEMTTNQNTITAFEQLDLSSGAEFSAYVKIKDEKVYGVKISQVMGHDREIEFPMQIKSYQQYKIHTSWPEDGLYLYSPYSLHSDFYSSVLLGFAYSIEYNRDEKRDSDQYNSETFSEDGYGLLRIDTILLTSGSASYGENTYGNHFWLMRFKLNPNKIMYYFFNGLAHGSLTQKDAYEYPISSANPKVIDSGYDTGISDIPEPQSYDVTGEIHSDDPNYSGASYITPAYRYVNVEKRFVIKPLFLVPIFQCGNRTTSEAMDVSRYRYREKNDPPPNGDVRTD